MTKQNVTNLKATDLYCEIEERDVATLTIDVQGDVNYYSNIFLIIYNNAREYPNTILKVENDRSNKISIVVPIEREQSSYDWLDGWNNKGIKVSHDKYLTLTPIYADNVNSNLFNDIDDFIERTDYETGVYVHFAEII